VVTNERLVYLAHRGAQSALMRIGEEVRHARLEAGVSQQVVAARARVSAPKISRIEAGKLTSLTLTDATRVAGAVGLDLVIKAYPGGRRPSDKARSQRLLGVLRHVADPLSYRTEVPLPPTKEYSEQRAWDGMLFGRGERTAIEVEMRLYDLQAQIRRFGLKRRDDPPDRFLLVVADTRANRRVLREFEGPLAELPRLRTSRVLGELRAGNDPPTGLILI